MEMRLHHRLGIILALVAVVGLLTSQQIISSAAISSSNIATYNQWGTILDCTFLVFTDGTTTYAKNCDTGAIDYSGTVEDTVIQSALDALTVGRTNQETVVFRGAFTLDGEVTITSYTRLDFTDAKFTMRDSGNEHMFVNSDTSGGNTRITIIGGTLDGNKANNQQAQTSDEANSIHFQEVTDSEIIGTTILDASNHATRFNDCVRCTIDRVTVSDARKESIDFENGSHVTLTNSYIFDSGFSAVSMLDTSHVIIRGNMANVTGVTSGTPSGITINGEYAILDGNQMLNAAGVGISIAQDHGDTFDSHNSVVSNNIVYNSGKAGITLNSNPTDGLIISNNRVVDSTETGIAIGGNQTNILVTGNIVTGSGLIGISVGGGLGTFTQDVTVSNNIVYNNAQTESANEHFRAGILVRSASLSDGPVNTMVVGNRAFDNQGTQTQKYGVYIQNTNNTTVRNNDVSGNSISGLTTAGTNNDLKISGNNGYITEAEGTGTINSGATNADVTHGLDYTPSAAEISITWTENPTNDPGNWWISGISSTQFTVNVRADPGASNLDFSWSVRRIN